MELFEQIRREYEFGIGTIVGVATKLGVHRRMVREAIGSALPKLRKKPERPRWKLREAVDFIDAILKADRKAPRKQRHTAHRIWTRIENELPRRRAFLQIQFAVIKHVFGSESDVESEGINHRYESDFVLFARDCSPREAQEDSMARPCGDVFRMVD